MTIPNDIFLLQVSAAAAAPLQRPSNIETTKVDRITPEIAVTRFKHERDVLDAQLQEWSVCLTVCLIVSPEYLIVCVLILAPFHFHSFPFYSSFLYLSCVYSRSLQETLLDVRKKRKQGINTLSGHTELGEGFFVKTEMYDSFHFCLYKLLHAANRLYTALPCSSNTESFIVSLGLQDSYIELELEEAIAYSQRRERYLQV